MRQPQAKKKIKRKRSAFGTGIKITLSLMMLVMLGIVGMVFFKYKDDISAWQQEATRSRRGERSTVEGRDAAGVAEGVADRRWPRLEVTQGRGATAGRAKG